MTNVREQEVQTLMGLIWNRTQYNIYKSKQYEYITAKLPRCQDLDNPQG